MNVEPSERVDVGDRRDHAQLITAATDHGEKVALTADWILQEFVTYYTESRDIPALAKQAFEELDHATSLALSKRRLALYSDGINGLGSRLREAFPQVINDETLWREVVHSPYWLTSPPSIGWRIRVPSPVLPR